ncbi:MAG: hypothetical protein ABI669_05620 [Usitatibacter sp.]
MSANASQHERQKLIASWVAQMIGTLVLAGVVTVFMRNLTSPFTVALDWQRYAMAGVLLGVVPALLYMRTFKMLLNADDKAVRLKGVPDPAIRTRLAKALAIGGALCEIPMAMGALQLFFGGEMRWFLGATLVTIGLRLSYRPFIKA